MIPPVLERELRSASRYWGTYWIRVLAGAMMLCGLLGLMALRKWGGSDFANVSPTQVGTILFGGFHVVLTVTFLWLCPLLTADCLSRERREGTLGLLFLTPLSAWDVVMGKGAAHVLRAFGLWFSAIPFLSVPFLLGGVLWTDFLRAVAIELTVVLVGLAAGLLATSRVSRWASAMLLALAWSVVLWLLLLGTMAFVGHAVMARLVPKADDLPQAEAWLVIPFFILLVSVAHGGLSGYLGASFPTWVMKGVDASLMACVVFSLVVFVLAILFAGWALRGKRRTAGASESLAGRGIWRRWAWSRRRARRWLDINPIRWLQECSPLLRRGRWGWLMGVLAVWAGIWGLSRIEEHFDYLGWLLPPLLLLFEALAAAGSFRQEVEEGTLEMLLVTTLPPSQMVWGRARALWATFGPALAASMLLPLLFLRPTDIEGWWYLLQAVVCTWLTLPLVGMRCAMRRLSPLVGWLLVMAWGVVAPMAIGGMAAVYSDGTQVFMSATLGAQVVAAVWWGRMTAWDLGTRNYMNRKLRLKST